VRAKERPAANGAHPQADQAGGRSGVSLALTEVDALDALAKAVDGTFVVVVEHPGARYRRRAYLTVASAERSAANARAKGHTVTVYLAELRPLWRLAGGAGR